jgi:glycyl-tRNA synthetase
LVEAELGSTEQSKEKVYMRGETCQIIFLQYLNVLDSMRPKIPFGIAQIGKAFRNEVTTKDFLYRMREFTQMEMEFFVHPDEGEKWYNYWGDEMLQWASEELGLPKSSFRFRDIPEEEKSHYAKIQKDFEFKSGSGKWYELSPLNHRGDWDLGGHQKHSGANFVYRDPYSNEEFIPNAIEISLGLDRIFYSLMDNAYTEDDDRVVLKLDKKVAPYRAAVFPLLRNKPKLVKKAQEIYKNLVGSGLVVAWDDRGNIGKRYLSQDEIGTPSCVTVDFQTLEDGTVTIRDRDTMAQVRVHEDDLFSSLK